MRRTGSDPRCHRKAPYMMSVLPSSPFTCPKIVNISQVSHSARNQYAALRSLTICEVMGEHYKQVGDCQRLLHSAKATWSNTMVLRGGPIQFDSGVLAGQLGSNRA